MTSRMARSAAALSIGGLVMVGFQVPASAQEGPPANPGQGSERCDPATNPGNKPNYPPGQDEQEGVSDDNAERGQEMTAWSGCREFAPGQQVAFGIMTPSGFQQLGTVVASAGGEATATFTVPTNLADGQYAIVFRGTGQTGAPNEVSVPFQVAGGPTAAPGSDADPSKGDTVNVGGVDLPRTGSDEVVPMTLLGLGLVGAGAGIVVLARRRRSETISPTA